MLKYGLKPDAYHSCKNVLTNPDVLIETKSFECLVLKWNKNLSE